MRNIVRPVLILLDIPSSLEVRMLLSQESFLTYFRERVEEGQSKLSPSTVFLKLLQLKVLCANRLYFGGSVTRIPSRNIIRKTLL